MANAILSTWAGNVAYEHALAWQAQLVAARQEGEIPDALLSLEHPDVYTAGRHADIEGDRTDAFPDIPVVRIDRGGQLTYHGPGQVVAYPIVRLGGDLGVREYVHRLEQALIDAVAAYGVAAERREGYPGVWVGRDKIAAIGIRVTRRVSKHGVALNVAPDLDRFAGVIPCGITDGGVTSLARLGVRAELVEVAARLREAIAHQLGRTRREVAPEALHLPLESAV